MNRASHLLLLLGTLVCAIVARGQVPNWPKTTPADVTAAGTNVQLTGADYGNNTFLLAAYFGGTQAVPATTPAVYTSPDGVTWTRRTLPINSGRTSHPRFLNGKFYLGVDGPNGGNGVVLSSADGVTWTSSGVVNAGLNAAFNFVFASGTYIGVVGANAPTPFQIITSTDGATWTPRTIAANTFGGNITIFNGRFYCTVFGGTGGGGLYSSADGVAWTVIPGAPANPGLIAASGTTLLVSYFSATGVAQSLSTDGATFTAASPGINLTSEMVRFLNNAFVTTGGSGNTFDHTLALASFDGRTWATIATVTNQFFGIELAFGNGRWVFVGEFDVFSGTTTVSPGGTPGGGGTGGGGTTTPPVIATQPGAQTIAVGGSVTFTVSATGTGLGYQWLFNNSPITGATAANFTIPAVALTNAGNYAVRVTNAGGSVTSNAASLTVNPASASIAFLSNLSVRARAGSGSETLIVGVTVGGSATNSPRSVLVRGIGPALTGFGVTGVLADPVLTILNGNTPIATNDDWGTEAGIAAISASVGAFALPAGSRDAALFGSGIGNGSYTIQVTGKAGATGNALMELYDTAPAGSVTATTTRFINVSARTFGGTGSDTLIVGFNVAGTGTRRLVIRAIGPGLAGFGVTGTMPDPKLELYSGQTKLSENDNWDSSTLAAQQSVGAFALTSGSRDAVLVATLNPGSYTVQVTGGTTGVVLVEAYEAP